MSLIRLDNRGLQPPEPMVRILDQLDRRAPGDILEAFMDRRPIFLYPELEERGLAFTCEPNDAGGFILRIEDGRRRDVVTALARVIDPELGLDIISLGLVYRIDLAGAHVSLLMTLTVPGCPMSASIRADVEAAVRALPWVETVDVAVTFDPPWSPNRLSPQARVLLGR